MNASEKNRISMRRRASEKFEKFLNTHLQTQEKGDQERHLFLSYSHKDRDWYERVYNMIYPLLNETPITPWSDEEIRTDPHSRRGPSGAKAYSFTLAETACP